MPVIPHRRTRLLSQARAAAAPRGEPEVEVSGLSVFALREPVSRRAHTVLRLDTRGGTIGYGECAALSPADIALARRAVIGKPATAFEVMRLSLAGHPALDAAVTMALLDIVGKIAKAPLYQVLGGPTRFKVRVMAPIQGDSEAVLNASRHAAAAFGHRAFVVPLPRVLAPNQGQAFVRAVRGRMEALRRDSGQNADYVLDGGLALTPGDASSVAAALERFHLLWFDEPCGVANLGAVRKITDECVTPVGFGRTLATGGEFQDLLREDAVDVLRPDLARHALTQIRKIAALAESYYVAVAPYHAGGPIATAAALHLAASLPNFFIQQIPHPEAERDQRMRAELTGGPVETVRDGYAALPAGAGLGINVSEDALRRYEERAG